MASLQERKIINLGRGSLIVTLPKPWLRFNGLSAGDKVEIISNGELRIRPIRVKKDVKKK